MKLVIEVKREIGDTISIQRKLEDVTDDPLVDSTVAILAALLESFINAAEQSSLSSTPKESLH